MATSHHPILQENHQSRQAQAMNQSVSGRKRSSKNVQKKKKPPQRGMGVEQLERLRMQDQIKNNNNIIHLGTHQYLSNNNFPNFAALSSFTVSSSTPVAASAADPGAYTNSILNNSPNFAATTTAAVGAIGAAADPGIYSNNSILNSSPVLHFPKLCVSPNHDFFLQQKVVNTGFIGSTTATVPPGPALAFGDQSQIDLYRFANPKPNTEKSKEISSMPNLFSSSSNNNSCFSDRCRSCNKKKRMINGEEMSIHMAEHSGTNPLQHQYPYSIRKGVEIVAIHRKGISSSFEDESVVMEYDFFLEKNGISTSTNNNTSCFEKTMKMMSTNNSTESSSVAAAAMGNINGESSSVTTISWATDTPTSSIDLSLKLSF